MARAETIESEIEELRRACYARAMREPPPQSDWKRTQRQLWAENESRASELLQPSLAILELGLDWLANVHLALNNEDDIGPRSPNFRVPWALSGAASAFGWSLRQACLTGFDTPARALLRTYVESLFLCLAVLYDKRLGEAYATADTDAKVVDFWHSHASPKNLHRRIVEIERTLGFDEELVTELTGWRRQEYEVLSQSSHLSYLAAGMTCLPASIEDSEMHRIGIFGRASANSHRTIGYAARTAWYFSRLAYHKILGPVANDETLLIVDKEDVNHQSLVVGWEVLSTLTRRHWHVAA